MEIEDKTTYTRKELEDIRESAMTNYGMNGELVAEIDTILETK